MAEQIKSLKTGIKYKDTPIGKIPVDWEVVRLKDICDVIGGSTPSTARKDFWNGDIPFATPTDITNLHGREISNTKQKITQEGLSSCGTRLLPTGSVLLTSRATIGACAINARPMATNQGFASLVCNEKAYNWYIFYEMMLRKSELQRLGSGSTFKEVSKNSLRQLNITLPPLAEQKKIAEILSMVDEAIEKTDQVIEKTKEAKKGLMQRLLNRGIGHKKFKKTEIGSIPVEWEVAKLGEICEVLDNKRIPLNKDHRSRMAGNIPYYGANGVVDYINDYIFDDELILMAEDGGYFDEYRHRPIAYMVKGKCWVNNHAHILKVKAPNSMLWVYYSVVHKNIIPFIKGGTRAKLNQEDLKQILIPLPDLAEQKKMANNLSDIDTEIEKESNYKIQLQFVKNGLMQVLLTGKIRVKA